MSSPSPDSEEHHIEDVIGGYYLFFQSLAELRDTIESAADIGIESRHNLRFLLEQLEGQFRENQEWIITRDVQEIRMGVVGTPASCKSTFISAFHEGVVELGEDEPNGRYKIKIIVGRKPCLLLIREESDNVSRQLSQWVDVIMFVFSYSNPSSLECLLDINKKFREYRSDLSEPQILLVGVVEDVVSKVVSESEVRRVATEIDNCRVHNTTLSQPSAVHNVFIDACRHYILSSTPYLPSTPSHSSNTFPPSPSHQVSSVGITNTSSNTGGKFFSDTPPLSSPNVTKKTIKKKTIFKHDRVGYSGNKPVGTGRIIPIKEGQIYKKSAGMRSDWKKKYLVLTERSLTYYPNHTDYMNQVHGKGKTLNLQHITVKVPGHHMPIAKTSSLPRSTVDSATDHHHQSDRSESMSPMVDVCSLNNDETASITVTPSSPPTNYKKEPKSPLSEGDSTDTLDELTKSDKYPFSHRNLGHLRNNSMDEVTLQLLKTSGATYPPPVPIQDEQQRDRSYTLNRIQVKKGKLIKGTMLSPISHSEEDLSEPSRSGSHENLKSADNRKGKKDNKNRNSLVLVERSGSDSVPVRDSDGKKDKKLSSKHRRNASQGFVNVMDTTSVEPQDTTEFHIHSLDGKVWSFDAGTGDEMNEWVKAIEGQIKKILEESLLPKRNSSNEEAKAKILAMKGNDLCADCGAPNPEWASLNHGCLVCIECSGVHRKLGSHISKIKGLHLDEWKPELVAVMTSIGNEESWKLFEGKQPRNKPSSSSSVEEREIYIRAKYINKDFLGDLPLSNYSLPLRLLDAVKSDDPIMCLHILAHCSINDVNYEHPLHNGGSALHVACNLGRVVIVQLLVWNSADVDLLDYQKHSPLFYARIAGYEDCAQILIQNNCNEDIGRHHSPLSSEFGSSEVLQ